MRTLERQKKTRGKGVHRSVPAAQTYRRVNQLMSRIGVTRLADITRLDRVGIPTFAAIVPDSTDVLSVYNGKGATRLDAKVGALMEAAERFTALEIAPPLLYGSFADLSAMRATLDPRALMLPMHGEYTSETRIAWVEGVELNSDLPIVVPAQAVGGVFEERYGPPCYGLTTTNGLASGNTLEEAICHALCELIERDAWTLAELRSVYIPASAAAVAGGHSNADRSPTIDPYLDLDLLTAPLAARRMSARFERCDIVLRVKDITSDLRIPTFFATTAEEVGVGYPLAHFGLGTHPDASVAVIRALTEVAQCRAVDIQGVREDISESNGATTPFAAHARRAARLDLTGWYYVRSSRAVAFSDVPTHENADIVDDIELLLRRLRGAGLERVIVVDLTRADLGIPVARVLVPGLESWAADRGRLGPRAVEHWCRWGGTLPT